MSRYEDSFTLKDEVSKSLLKINKNLESFNNKLKGSEVQLANFQKKTESIRNMGKGLQDFGNKMTVGVTLPIIGAMTYASKMGMEFQDAEMRLQTMLGSAEKGTEMFNKIVEMGAKTPFEARDLLNATNTMLGFGVAQERVLPLMMQLGDISAGNRERFQQLALAFSQVSAAGKLQGQDLLQMINAGFNPLEQIAKRTGKTVGYWKDEMSKGKVTVAMVEQAMKDATSEGGRFNGMMDKMSKTASGKLSTMMDNFNTAMAQLGQVLLPYVTKGIEKITEWLEKFTKLSPKTQKMILVIGGIAAVIGPLITVLGSLVTVIGGINTALAALLANPVALTIIAWTSVIAGIAAGIWALIKAVQTLIDHFKFLNKMKMPGIRTDNLSNEDMKKLGALQASMGEKSFTAKYGKEVSKQVNNYRQSKVQNTTNNNRINNNFYGNINSSGSMMLDNILNGGNNVPSFG